MDILVCEEIDPLAIATLAERHTVVQASELWRNPDALKERIREARTIMVRNQTLVTPELLAVASNLIGIGRVGVGLDNIDLQAATNLGVVVIAPLNANAVSVAELAMGLLLALIRKIPLADRSTKSGGWERKACTGIELDGKTLAICGFGRIGRLVAARARAFGLRVLVYDPFIKADSPALSELGAKLCQNLEEALGPADFVTVHSPLTSETKRLMRGLSN